MSDRAKVLVGVDGSEDGLRATRYGAGQAKRRDDDLWLVNAVDDAMVTAGWGVIYDPAVLAEAGRSAVDQATAVAVAAGIEPERIHADVMVGHPVSVLGELSKQADVVVVGRRSSSGFERMFVGSTSTSLVAVAGCPLIVISAASTPEPTGRFHKITVAVGGSGDKAVRWAAEEARRAEASLDVVHILPNQAVNVVDTLPASAVQERQWEDRVAVNLEKLIAPVRQDYPEVEFTLRARRGLLADQLIQETAAVDLIVLGVKARPPLALGGPIRGVLAHSACPVALVAR